MKFAMALCASALASVPVAALAQTSVTIAETAPVVTLNVTESVEGAPDVVTFGTGVETRAMAAKDAMAANAAQMDKLIAALAKAGIAKKDIQTSGIRLNPQFDYPPRSDDGTQPGPRFTGYVASNQLSVTLRDVAKAGETIDKLIAAGATNISGPNFAIDDPAPMLAQARGAALKSAKAQADFYAQAAGYRAARLISITESNSGGMPPMPMMAAARFKADASTPVEPGQVSASVTLTVQYALDK